MAGAIWSSYLDDDVTVNIYVEVSDESPDNVVGGGLPRRKDNINYERLRDNLSEDITYADDILAFYNLPSDGNNFKLIMNGNKPDRNKKLNKKTYRIG